MYVYIYIYNKYIKGAKLKWQIWYNRSIQVRNKKPTTVTITLL